jgi:uncharacterized membrane protein
MTRARTRSTTRKTASGPFDPFTWLATLLLRWQTFAVLAVVALGLIAFAAREPVGGFLGDTQRWFVRTFGLGIAFLVVGLVVVTLALYLHRWPVTRRGLLRLAGGLALIVFIWGIAGWPAPRWAIGGVSLNEVTLGGDVGRFLGRSLYGLLIWFWCGVAAAFILAPRATWKVLNTLPPASRRVASWRVPQRTGGMPVSYTHLTLPTKA